MVLTAVLDDQQKCVGKVVRASNNPHETKPFRIAAHAKEKKAAALLFDRCRSACT